MTTKFEAFIKAKQERRLGNKKEPAQAFREFIEYRDQKKALVEKLKPRGKRKRKQSVDQSNQPENWSFLDD